MSLRSRGDRALLAALTLCGLSAPARASGGDDDGSEPWPAHRSLAIPVGHTLVLMTGMRATEAIIWPEPFAEVSPNTMWLHYREAFTRAPKWQADQPWYSKDGDPWAVNLVGHALFGSEVMLRARACGQSPLEAFLLTAAASTAWEYVWEANGARPSGWDLMYTPLAGLVLGELRFQGFRAARGVSSPALRAVLQTTLDPLGELERALGTRC